MNETPANSESLRILSRLAPHLPLILAVALMPLMITNESLWLDEGDTAIYAIQPSLSAWVGHLQNDVNADCQMPLTMFTSWLVGAAWGASEWALRGQNILFGAIALGAMYGIGKRSGQRWLPLLMAVQPFFWFYMDEARPYVAQIAGGAVLAWVVSLVCYEEKMRGRWLFLFSLAALGLFSTSMLSAVCIASAFLACLIWGGVPRVGGIRRPAFHVFVVWLLMALLLAYYIWTVLRGAEGTRIWGMDWKAIGFIGYELVGCLGLGPSLDDIRLAAQAGGILSLLSRLALPGLLLGSAVALASFYYFSRSPRSSCERNHSRACLIVVLLVFVLMIATSIAIHKPLWARHLSSIFPFLVCLEAYWIKAAVSKRSIFSQGLAVLFLLLLMASSCSVRFSPLFAKDDYRRAADIAKTTLSRGGEVWWSAAEYTAMFYHVPLDTKGEANFSAARVPRQIPDVNISTLPPPNVIIVTRSEVYDQNMGVRNFISRHGYTIVEKPFNFLIYERRAGSN